MTTQEQSYLLAIDNGTQSVRALVFNLKGQLIAKTKVEIEPYYSKKPGWAEQDLGYIWDNLCKACNQLWEEIDFPKEWIKGASITTQRATRKPFKTSHVMARSTASGTHTYERPVEFNFSCYW